MDDLNGTTAFVTGGASGVGLGIARALLERGAKVAVADLRADQLAGVQRDHPELLTIRLDVTDREGMAAALDETEAKLGPLRILVNNAGVGIVGPVDEAAFADWDWGLSVNIGGVVNGLVHAVPRIKAHGKGGHIVNTASLGALMPARHTRGIYATTKAAVITLSEHLRLDLQDSGIGVSALCPGPVASSIADSGKIRPAHLREGSRFLQYEQGRPQPKPMTSTAPPEALTLMDPIEAGRITVQGILDNRLYIITHPAFLGLVRERNAGIEQAMSG